MDITTELKKTLDGRSIKKDLRLSRSVRSATGISCTINGKELEELKTSELKEKYHDDLDRMYSSLQLLTDLVRVDPSSRRLLATNMDGYLKVFPCFLFMHFLQDGQSYKVFIYLRSSDLSKLEDDCGFFGYIIRRFEEMTNKIVSSLILVFGDLHYEIT